MYFTDDKTDNDEIKTAQTDAEDFKETKDKIETISAIATCERTKNQVTELRQLKKKYEQKKGET